jgi:hypothetical protein
MHAVSVSAQITTPTWKYPFPGSTLVILPRAIPLPNPSKVIFLKLPEYFSKLAKTGKKSPTLGLNLKKKHKRKSQNLLCVVR